MWLTRTIPKKVKEYKKLMQIGIYGQCTHFTRPIFHSSTILHNVCYYTQASMAAWRVSFARLPVRRRRTSRGARMARKCGIVDTWRKEWRGAASSGLSHSESAEMRLLTNVRVYDWSLGGWLWLVILLVGKFVWLVCWIQFIGRLFGSLVHFK